MKSLPIFLIIALFVAFCNVAFGLGISWWIIIMIPFASIIAGFMILALTVVLMILALILVMSIGLVAIIVRGIMDMLASIVERFK